MNLYKNLLSVNNMYADSYIKLITTFVEFIL